MRANLGEQRPTRVSLKFRTFYLQMILFLFGKATAARAETLKEVLNEYKCFGQCINFNKSTIFFSTNTSSVVCLNVSGNLGARCSNDSEDHPIW